MADPFSLALYVVVDIIILIPVLWFVGRRVVGKDKVKLRDAIFIVLIGIAVQTILTWILPGYWPLIGYLVVFIIWRFLIKYFFGTGWIRAIITGFITVIIFLTINLILSLIGSLLPSMV